MKKDGVFEGSLSRRQLLKGAVSAAALVSASSFVGAADGGYRAGSRCTENPEDL